MVANIIRRQPFFCTGLLVFLLSALVAFRFVTPKQIFVNLNFFHCRSLDILFRNYTIIGDGIFSVVVFLLLVLFKRITLAVQVIVTYLLSGMAAQLIKNIIAAPRPKVFFSANEYHYFIEGVTHGGLNSFPSGHTTSAFALATLFCLHSTSNKQAGLGYFFIALMVGYSRIYLGQHFLQDVVAGAVLGTLSAMLVYWRLREVNIDWWANTQTGMRVLIHK